MAEKEREVKELRDEVARVTGLVRSRTELQRNIEDNIQYRNSCREEEEMIKTIEGLEAQLASKGDLQMLKAEKKRADGDLLRLLSEVSVVIRQKSRALFHWFKVMFSLPIFILRSVKLFQDA